MGTERIDLGVLLERVGGDLPFLCEMAGVFLEDYPKDLEAIKAALNAGHFQDLEHSAHKLKSSLYAFGLGSLAQLALQLEVLGREQSPLSPGKEILTNLNCGLELVAPDLRALIERRQL